MSSIYTNTDMKGRAPKNKNDQNKVIQIKVANYGIEGIIKDFKPNLTLLNKIIYATASAKC